MSLSALEVFRTRSQYIALVGLPRHDAKSNIPERYRRSSQPDDVLHVLPRLVIVSLKCPRRSLNPMVCGIHRSGPGRARPTEAQDRGQGTGAGAGHGQGAARGEPV